MAVVKVMGGRQVVIPKELFEELELKIGDYLEAKVQNGKIVYTPKELVDRDPWYWSQEGQRRIGEALKDIEEGRVVGPFTTAQEVMKSLKKRSKA
jgi:bifunctional DNA-binding transcriptional regulator/antitoxin component of YhaV-PrlF toxin-antitoxin module